MIKAYESTRKKRWLIKLDAMQMEDEHELLLSHLTVTANRVQDTNVNNELMTVIRKIRE